jgi:hypothetical protein
MIRVGLVLVASAVLSVPADCFAGCGARLDGCQTAEYNQLLEVAVNNFPDWSEREYRLFVSACIDAHMELRRECMEKPREAARQLNVHR